MVDPDPTARMQPHASALATPPDARGMLDSLLRSMPDFVLRVSRDGRIEYINRLVPELTLEAVLGQPVEAFTEPAFHPVLLDALARARATGEPTEFESQGLGPGGQQRDYLTRVGPIREQGETVGFTFVATDITGMKASMRALERAVARADVAVAASGIGFWTWESGPDRVEWDEAARVAFGFPPGVGEGTLARWLAMVHPGDRSRLEEALRTALERGEYPAQSFRAAPAGGEARFLLTTGRVFRGPDDKVLGLRAGVLDVTERRKLEEHVQQTQRMEAVGLLAAGVAHNFNNFLGAIIPAVELAARRAPQVAGLLANVREAAERAAGVVRQLMTFAGRRTAPERIVLEPIDRVVDRTLQLARPLLGSNLSVEFAPLGQECCADIDPGELEQALLNLLINARDAIDARGTAGPRWIHVSVSLEATAGVELPAVCLRVADCGIGMTEEVKRRAVEPFFTTKDAGRGTGLGLSTVYAVARARGGELELASVPHEGTTVTLCLPRVVPRPRPPT